MGSLDVLTQLRRYESRNITWISKDRSWPIVWKRAQGSWVWDEEGRKYLDLTAAFGVAACGHSNPHIVRAGQRQMARLLHAMGDVHPHALKAKLAQTLSEQTFGRWSRRIPSASSESQGKVIFCNSGFEAVEAALKTAALLTQKPGVIAFSGAYHGVGYGTLNVTDRSLFREPFASQLGKFGHFAPFPRETVAAEKGRGGSKSRWFPSEPPISLDPLESNLRKMFRRYPIGAILVEPVQGRGGIRVPPPEFLPMLRRLSEEHGALLVFDEIYTGFGRTGRWFACEHTQTVPDILCLGKAMTGGFPMSVCIGKKSVMDRAWPPSQGEAIHTSTFLGHPVGCAMALAQIRELGRTGLVERSLELGLQLREWLSALAPHRSGFAFEVRGLGLMTGLEVRSRKAGLASKWALRAVQQMLKNGFILLPEGEHGNVISFTPPLTISERDLHRCVDCLAQFLP